MKLNQLHAINEHLMNSIYSICQTYGKNLPPVEVIVELTDATMEYITKEFPDVIGDYGQMYLLIGNTIANHIMMYRQKVVWGK